MSDDNNDKPKILGAKIHFTECDRGGMHVTGVEPITEESIVYDAPGSDEVLKSSTFGWSRSYGKAWERNFGEKPEISDDVVN